MQQSDFALTLFGTSPLAVTAVLVIVTAVFTLSVLGYLRVSSFFQSKRRRGWFRGDGAAIALATTLFLTFSLSYLEIFAVAFQLPFSAYQDLAIGLGAVGLAVVSAQGLSGWASNRSERLKQRVPANP